MSASELIRRTKVERCLKIVEALKSDHLTITQMKDVIGCYRSTMAEYKDLLVSSGLICADGVSAVQTTKGQRKTVVYTYCGTDELVAKFRDSVMRDVVSELVSTEDTTPQRVVRSVAKQIGIKPDMLIWMSYGKAAA